MENPDRPRTGQQPNPMISSLLGGFRQSGRNQRETTEESMRYPPEILLGFAVGSLLAVLLIAAALWLFRMSFFEPVTRAIFQPGTIGFWLFWIAAGLLTALLVTGAFMLFAGMQAREVIWKPWPVIHVIPATGENEEEEKDEPEE